MDSDARDLIDKLLDYNPEKRLGYNNFYQLKSHLFFTDVDFQKIYRRDIIAPNLEVFGVTQ